MEREVIVPKLTEMVADVKLIRWLVKVGDRVEADQAICELETEKVMLELPAPTSGILNRTLFVPGDMIEVGSVIATISEED